MGTEIKFTGTLAEIECDMKNMLRTFELARERSSDTTITEADLRRMGFKDKAQLLATAHKKVTEFLGQNIVDTTIKPPAEILVSKTQAPPADEKCTLSAQSAPLPTGKDTKSVPIEKLERWNPVVQVPIPDPKKKKGPPPGQGVAGKTHKHRDNYKTGDWNARQKFADDLNKIDKPLGKGGAGPCPHCSLEFVRLLKHVPHCTSNPKNIEAEDSTVANTGILGLPKHPSLELDNV